MRRCSALVLLALHGACAAPLVQDAGPSGPSARETLAGARPIEVRTGDGMTLRGLFLEAAADAPVVLHLLPSAASTETGVPAGIGRVALDGMLERFRDLGWSSLVVDYRGLGRSDGCRDARRLGSDGEAMWREAVRRAGGSADRVVLRAVSLGSLVAADLLARCAESDDGDGRPAAAVLVAPVRSTTVVRNVARDRSGALAAWWAGLVYRTPDLPDLETVVASTGVPLLVVLPAEDPYLPREESARLDDAARAAGHRVEALASDHAQTVLRAWGFAIDADGFAGQRVSTLLEAERLFLDGLGLTP
ncbi:MAG: hypothetical protein AAGB93_02075 [Planctomycetota bacterium]